MTNKLFSIAQDKRIIEDGGFFCEACIVAKPLDDQSKDPRLCFTCYEVLHGEGTGETKSKDGWMQDKAFFVCDSWKYGIAKDGTTVCVGPVSGATKASPAQEEPVQNSKDIGKVGRLIIAQPEPVPCQPINRKKATGAGGQRPGAGRKQLALPVDLIKDLHTQGADVAEIMNQLQDKGFPASRRTIYTILAGQKVML